MITHYLRQRIKIYRYGSLKLWRMGRMEILQIMVGIPLEPDVLKPAFD